MEKRPFPVFPRIAFLFSVLSIVGIVHLGIDAIIGYARMPKGASGADYLGFLIYPILCIPMAVIGAVSSTFCGIKTTITWVKIVSFIMLGVCVAVLFPFVAMLIGWTDPAWVIIQIAKWFANLFV